MPVDKELDKFNFACNEKLDATLPEPKQDPIPLCCYSEPDIVELVLKDIARKHKLSPADFVAEFNDDKTVTLYDADDQAITFKGTFRFAQDNWYERYKAEQVKHPGSIFDNAEEVFCNRRSASNDWYRRSQGA